MPRDVFSYPQLLRYGALVCLGTYVGLFKMLALGCIAVLFNVYLFRKNRKESVHGNHGDPPTVRPDSRAIMQATDQAPTGVSEILTAQARLAEQLFKLLLLDTQYLSLVSPDHLSQPSRDLKSRTGQTRLPDSIIHAIVDVLSSPRVGAPKVALDDTSDYPCASRKPPFDDVRALSCANRALRRMVLSTWFRTLYVRWRGDWDRAVEMQICHYVLELRALAPSLNFTNWFCNTALARFPRLHTVFLDTHNDSVPREFAKKHAHFKKLLIRYPDADTMPAYLFLVWPDTLRRIWITNTHYGQDLVSHISSMCPELQELRISRCTIFSENASGRAGQRCKFYSEEKDHATYFLNTGPDGPWRHLQHNPLSNLKVLDLGVYNAIGLPFRVHAEEHPHLSDSSTLAGVYETMWMHLCVHCVRTFGPGELMSGAIISQELAIVMPQLKKVLWPLFCSRNRITRIVWTCDNVLHVPRDVLNKLTPLDLGKYRMPRLVPY